MGYFSYLGVKIGPELISADGITSWHLVHVREYVNDVLHSRRNWRSIYPFFKTGVQETKFHQDSYAADRPLLVFIFWIPWECSDLVLNYSVTTRLFEQSLQQFNDHALLRAGAHPLITLSVSCNTGTETPISVIFNWSTADHEKLQARY